MEQNGTLMLGFFCVFLQRQLTKCNIQGANTNDLRFVVKATEYRTKRKPASLGRTWAADIVNSPNNKYWYSLTTLMQTICNLLIGSNLY